MEHSYLVQPREHQWVCHNCRGGEYIFYTERPLTEKGYEHICNRCGTIVYLDKIYPYLTYEKWRGR